MHGAPRDMAPREQIDIPFIIWTSDDAVVREDLSTVGHYHVFHTVLGRLAVESPVYNARYDIFATGR